MHTLMDSTSPSHEWYQTWEGTDSLAHDLAALSHVMGESTWLGLHPMTANINRAVSLLQDYGKEFVRTVCATCPDVARRMSGVSNACCDQENDSGD